MATRREFLERASSLGLAAAAGNLWLPGIAHERHRRVREFTLTAAAGKWDVGTGSVADAWLFNGQYPGPELRVTEGDIIRVTLHNRLTEPTTIHWHGIPLPFGMDGVPDLTQAPVAPGATFTYEYPASVPGSYWYHSHFGYQLERGLLGPLVIEPRRESLAYDREVVLVLDDWLAAYDRQIASARPYNTVLGGVMTGAVNMRMTDRSGTPAREATDLVRPDNVAPGAHRTHSDPRHEPVFDQYTINGRSGGAVPELAVADGDRIRFRFVNASTASVYPLYLAGHRFTITHLDGQPITPFETDLVVVGMGERVDAIVTARNPGVWKLASVDERHRAKGLAMTVRYKGVRDSAAQDGPIPRMQAQPYRGMTGLAERDAKPADRTYALDLRWNDGTAWSINGRRYPDTDKLIVEKGQRVRLDIRNNSMFAHPIHLHGHFFDVVQPYFGVAASRPLRKDTLTMYHMERHVVEFDADNPGPRWFVHCHNQYHHMGGMATEIVYR